jgi:hypothetical protein
MRAMKRACIARSLPTLGEATQLEGLRTVGAGTELGLNPLAHRRPAAGIETGRRRKKIRRRTTRK